MLPPLIFALLATIIPTTIYVYLIWWCDRYEREPGWLLFTAFVWGAVPAVVLSLVMELIFQGPPGFGAPGLAGDLWRMALISPVVEEGVKGLALLALIAFFRTEFDDVLDGIVYGALIGVGFGMTENFVYLVAAALDGWGTLFNLTLLRSLVFGLNHAFYTAITGAALGFAVWQPTAGRKIATAFGGLALAMAAHALHNLSATLASTYPVLLLLSLLLGWGGVLILVAIIILAQRQEQGWIRTYLADEVPAVLSAEQYQLVLAHPQRLGKWSAMLRGVDSGEATRQAAFHQAATELAFGKHRAERLGGAASPELLADVDRRRERVVALSQSLR
jgi:RsiW-degrading membrane proteinase PrsW (M82 family)